MSLILTDLTLTQWLVLLVGLLGTIVIVSNLLIIAKLNNGNFKNFAKMTLSLIIIFSIAGFLRSMQVFDVHEYAGIELRYFEYSIYCIVYAVAAIKIYSISKTFGFAE